MKFSSDNSPKYVAEFNFSSLTDIVMLLLIFFLLTSSFVTTKGLDVVLPEASNTEKQQDLRLYVSVDEAGKIAVNDDEVAKADLASRIAEKVSADTTAIVVLRADQNLPYSTVVELLDIIKGAGARRFFLATERPKE